MHTGVNKRHNVLQILISNAENSSFGYGGTLSIDVVILHSVHLFTNEITWVHCKGAAVDYLQFAPLLIIVNKMIMDLSNWS